MASSSARRHRLAEDAVVGQFVIGGEIGKGSFAQVSGAVVAVKSVELARLNKKLKENLYGEIKILKTLRHPHIVALHDCVESATHINLVMEYCELGDLSMFIKKREKLVTNPATHDMARKYPSAPNSGLNEVITRHFLKQLASALKFLREGNFVHRDVKPQNLLLLPSPQFRDVHKSTRPILTASNDSLIPVAGLASLPMLKLADFGFARVLPSTTLAETLCGSPLYMAPEILRYERYDAKADLWSVGTVLYEMVCGRPPFRASNHVELLRKIEAAEDLIKFPRDCIVTTGMKSLIRALLKRNPVERLSFENFFNHEVVTGPIPGLVEDDIPRPERQLLERVPERRSTRDLRQAPTSAPTPSSYSSPAEPAAPATAAVTASATPPSRRHSFRRYIPESASAGADSDREVAAAIPASPRDRSSRGDPGVQRMSYSPRHHDIPDGLGIRRPQAQPSVSAPSRPGLHDDRKHRLSSASLKQQYMQGKDQLLQMKKEKKKPTADNAIPAEAPRSSRGALLSEEQERAAQDIAFERDYVVVEKKHVEVNAFADEMAANPRLTAQYQVLGGSSTTPPKTMVRRATQQGHPTSSTGAIAPTPSRAMQVAQGALSRPYHGERQTSMSASPNSTTSFIAKAIHDASFRLLGVKNPAALIGKGASPPQLYSPFPSYPTPSGPPSAALLTDGRPGSGVDDGTGYGGGSAIATGASANGDARVALLIEDYATRSDVVYGFAEVKYKQLMPLAPSAEHDLSGLPAADKLNTQEDEDELTIDAIVVLSEEALVLYVKALSLLAKSMDIAGMWWKTKMRDMPGDTGRGSSGGGGYVAVVRDSPLGQRINAAVQWVRSRFNEVLEKATFARERLLEAQRRLPVDHPSHPSNHNRDPVGSAGSSGGVSTDGVFLSSGVSAEKLMYDRAVDMSRSAAIGEISNDDLAGCELSYVTAICMLEAVLDTDEDATVTPRRKVSGGGGGGSSGSYRDEKSMREEDTGDINMEDQKTVEMMITMIKQRLAAVRKKARLISSHSRAAQQQHLIRRRSGDVTPRSVPSHAS
ncbi:serine/threonine-protein kinase [Grosmannia clavigera kw1407]|uniref:non-specific serine/threonine protein kinase n=1 Tax=Grosmannia clavigera (strain kw1407 / UAMH 11150) TaxID=655863 RepID=F0XGW7_GROCL|nr:serine/threonine-protein kinase [Grosmannia clavigera kw1407]EFX02807.1 serine/threonine-protein kinase [Grosmannia clavigera kw1407]